MSETDPVPTTPAPKKPRKRAAKTALALQEAAPKSPAASAHERLVLYIRNFESQLDQTQEIAMGFAGSDAGVLQIEGLGYSEPDLVTFYGRDEAGLKTQLVQHISQLSLMLRAVPKLKPEAPPRRIGFRLATGGQGGGRGGWPGGEAGDGSVFDAWAQEDDR